MCHNYTVCCTSHFILPDAHYTALSAAELVKVTYTNVQPPILTIKDAIQAGSMFPDPADPIVQGDAAGEHI